MKICRGCWNPTEYVMIAPEGKVCLDCADELKARGIEIIDPLDPANICKCGTQSPLERKHDGTIICGKCIAREEGWNIGPGIDSIEEVTNA